MTLILIVEDDDAIRNNIVRLLKLEGFETAAAPDGRQGLELARSSRPDLIISDVGMPGMNGFELLDAVRADRVLVNTPFMLLTALDDRESMRRGMTAGADDYLSKPFNRAELLDAVNAQLKKKQRVREAIDSGVAAGEERLRAAFASRISGGRPAEVPIDIPPSAETEELSSATVLVASIRNFTSLAEKLNAAEVSLLLTEYFERTSESVLKNSGRHIKFIGDGLMAVFSDTLTGSPLPASRRAISAALAMALATHEFRDWLNQRFGERALPPFAMGVGIHSGAVTLCQLGAQQTRELTPVGETVTLAARLESASEEMGWTVMASEHTLGQAGPGIETGTHTSLVVPGKNLAIDVAEVTGLVTTMEDKIHGMASLTERAGEISDAVRANSDITARAVKSALDSKLSALKGLRFDANTEPVRLKGYRITRKIGAGGMTEVYLSERESDGLPIVLKVLDSRGQEASEHLVRFIQEYALLCKIDHPHVIKIYDQGFTDEHAYIAMEYFECGDLRGLFGPNLAREQAVTVARQIAEALSAIHEHGIVHRDIKPENVMLRADGSVALADFGIAKSMLQAHSMGLTQTHHGDVVGTPYYMSPEQATGRKVTAQSDLYSLGVMFFEMLAHRRPYIAESLELLLAKHLNAETPPLPPQHVAMQGIVNKLMAKNPNHRYESAAAFLDDLNLVAPPAPEISL
ncbi:Serine/threonine protein kinase [Polaromonas sp. YR568]|uniref:protein kinase domain-containing protein n=1 Tax=Polaromonas sp. YR568 TaxID=1855301 RepID=UPI0008F2094B|nr:protein kinase [Polaromonas sp. YR568]SFU92477.1 Serine/threonine protein kinase [Polaromonas sp. YR568]